MCDFDFDGEGTLGFWTQTHPVARQARRCVLCKRTIWPGERYLRESSKWDGTVSATAACVDCENDRNEFAKAHGNQFPFMETFWQYLTECIVDDDEGEKWKPMLMRIIERIPPWRRTEGVLQWLEPEEAEA